MILKDFIQPRLPTPALRFEICNDFGTETDGNRNFRRLFLRTTTATVPFNHLWHYLAGWAGALEGFAVSNWRCIRIRSNSLLDFAVSQCVYTLPVSF